MKYSHPNLLPQLRLGVAVAALLGLMLAAALGPGPGTARAQDRPVYEYVDLVMRYEQGPSSNRNNVKYSVQNNGSVTATGVTVSFLFEGLEADDGDFGAAIIKDKRTENNTNERLTWEIGNIPPAGTSFELSFSTALHSGISVPPDGEYEIGVISARASSNEPEPTILSGNNFIKLYSFANSAAPATSQHMANNRLALLLSVDGLRPDAGGDVDFGLTAHDAARGGAADIGSINAIVDINIKVELSDGLEFKGDWDPPSEFVKSGSQSATWGPEPVDRKADTSKIAFPIERDIEIQTQLTSHSLEDIPLEERCITARVTDSKPPPQPGLRLGQSQAMPGRRPAVAFQVGVDWASDTFSLYRRCQSHMSRPEWRQYQRFQSCSGCGCSSA